MKCKGLQIKNYIWNSFNEGIYTFVRIDDKYKWFPIECSEQDIENGNLEVMIDNGYTLSKERIKMIRKLYLKNQRG